MNARPLAALAVVAAVMLAGCDQVVSGHAASGGATAPTSGPPTSGATSTHSGSVLPQPHLACPHVVDPASRLAYDCASDDMAPGRTAQWPVQLEKQVEKAGNITWTMDEGSARVVAPAGLPLTDVAGQRARDMYATSYGTPGPTVKFERSEPIKVGSSNAYLIQTLITLNPAYRSTNHLKVRQERLWIVAVQVAPTAFGVWYVSVPDLQKQVWPKVPALIKSIKVV